MLARFAGGDGARPAEVSHYLVDLAGLSVTAQGRGADGPANGAGGHRRVSAHELTPRLLRSLQRFARVAESEAMAAELAARDVQLGAAQAEEVRRCLGRDSSMSSKPPSSDSSRTRGRVTLARESAVQ